MTEEELGAAEEIEAGEGTAVEEQVFIPYRMSYQTLQNNLGRLCYVNSSGTAYFYLNRTVYKIEPETGEFTEIISDINPDCFVSSGGTAPACRSSEKPMMALSGVRMSCETAEKK